MKLIVGLGNPGTKYEYTRHNAGFMVLDFLAQEMKCDFKAGKGDYYYLQTRFSGEDILLLKPSTYMNNSGLAILQILEKFPDIKHEDILILYDDFQLKLGTIRIREKGSDGGHNGISSVIYHLESTDIPRMRVGIGRGETMKKDEFVDFVLTNFEEEELKILKKMMPIYRDCVICFIKEPIRKAMTRFNKHFIEEDNKGDSEIGSRETDKE